MPVIFKTLANVVVWILFIGGCLLVLLSLVLMARDGGARLVEALRFLGGAGFLLFLSVVTAWFRKQLD